MEAGASGDEAAAASAAAAASHSHPKPRRRFLNLPAETQQEIISHCSQSELICVALVCRRFHELASAQLYRNFHIVFPDDDDINFDSPIDGLAGGLDTFTTSGYNYAKYLRDLSMDTLSAGVKGEHSYQPYLYSASCGKFLNTLLSLTLKKAKSLEAFRWNIRVELSRPVYRELHRISSLSKLHVRMQAGDSYYKHPPPLPVPPETHAHSSSAGHWPSPPPPLAAAHAPSLPAGPPQPLEAPSKSSSKSHAARRGPGPGEPSTFSGFKNLKCLSVLDIDSIDVVPELRTCVKNSYSTLKELQLSLSDALAQRARKPPPDSDADDSDVDDDFQVVPASQNTSYDASGPAKAFRAQEERKVQEAILGRILDVEQTLVKKPAMERSPCAGPSSDPKGKGVDKDPEPMGPRDMLISSIKEASAKLMALQNGSRDLSSSQQDILDTIERAARKYVDSVDPSPNNSDVAQSLDAPVDSALDVGLQPVLPTRTTGAVETLENATKEPTPVGQSILASAAATGPAPVEAAADTALPVDADGPSEATPKANNLDGDGLSPDDIDIAHIDTPVEEQEDDEQATATATPPKTTAQTDKSESTMLELTKLLCTETDPILFAEAADEWERLLKEERAKLEPLTERLGFLQTQTAMLSEKVEAMRSEGVSSGSPEMQLIVSKLQVINKSATEIFNDVCMVEDEVDTLSKVLPAKVSETGSAGDKLRRYMDAYARETRGLALESLRIHLVPVKASVLSRGIDLSCLKELTLLNVGSQTPIWMLLAKEGKMRPLALRRVFTDHVTTAFLSCMAQLPELHDLFLMERGIKHKPESFATRSTTTIDQIRRLVLRKHMHTLKRLMIKDESNGPNWDANEKTMILICTRGSALEELALSMNIHAVHAFMQYFSGLTSLRAINILHFRNNDTCIWVMREILRFIVDNLSHHPELKLEWIAMEDERVDRVVRPSEPRDKSRQSESAKKAKGKGKEKSHVAAGATLDGAFPLLPVGGLDSESESEDEGLDSGRRLRFKTVGPLQFYDLWGVKIFEKEIRSGRL